MKKLFEKSFAFIKKNPAIIFSIFLAALIPATIFFNTFYILNRFEKNIDNITQAKAILVENIIGAAIEKSDTSTQYLNDLVEKISQENETIRQLTIFSPSKNNESSFKVIASTDKNTLEKEDARMQNILAWNREEGIAYLNEVNGERFWNITKIIKNDQQEKAYLISLSFSLRSSDELINSTILRSYWVLLATIIVIFFLMANNVKFFGYALTVAKLREIDKMKDTFISMASHELRSPLTAIKGYLELLSEKQSKQPPDKESRHYLENISSSVNRLNLLVNDILEISRLEGNRIPIKIATVDPGEIIETSVAEMKSQADQKNLSLEYPQDPLPKIKADPERVKQIFINLLSNAIKYTPKGKVEITAKEKDGKLFITFADSGIGISAQEQAHLFQKFYRVKNEKTQKISGTGLGLWITRELSRKMNGDIAVESIEGVGSHFTVNFPLAKTD